MLINKKFKYLSDKPITLKEHDKFNFNFYVDEIEDILNNSHEIMNIGLYGKWGIGKSSILHLLKERFKESDNKLIILDAWTLSQYYLKQDFLLSINNEFNKIKNVFGENELIEKLLYTKTIPQPKAKKCRYSRFILKNLLYITSILAIILVSITQTTELEKNPSFAFLNTPLLPSALTLSIILAIFDNAYPKIKELLDSLIKSSQVESTRIIPKAELSYQFEKIFSELIDKLLETHDKGKAVTNNNFVIIAIDNLDRCKDDIVIEILETIKTFMNNTKCKFIIACDNISLEKHLKNVYNIQNEEENFANEYLKKIFQVTLNIHPIIPGDLNNYTKQLINNIDEPIDAEAVEIFVSGIKNPRKISHAINNFMILYNIAKRKEEAELINKNTVTKNTKFLAKMTVLREEFPEFYRYLEDNEFLLDAFERSYIASDKNLRESIDQEEITIEPHISKLINENKQLHNFLRSTIGITTDDILSFLYIGQEDYEIHVPDKSVFYQKINEGDENYVSSKLLTDSKYFDAFISYINKFSTYKNNIYVSNALSILILNFEKFDENQQIKAISCLDQQLKYVQVMQYAGKFNKEKTFSLLKRLDKYTISQVLNFYLDRLFITNTTDSFLFRQIINSSYISNANIKKLNNKIGENLFNLEDADQILESLNEKRLIESSLVDVLVKEITRAQKSKDYYKVNIAIDRFIKYKDYANAGTKANFVTTMIELLITSNTTENTTEWNSSATVNRDINFGLYGLNKLDTKDFPDNMVGNLYDILVQIYNQIISKRKSDRIDRYKGIDNYQFDVIKIMLLIFNKLENAQKNLILKNYLEYEINQNFIAQTKELIKNNKVKILDYDRIATEIIQNIADPCITLELFICATSDKDKVISLLSEYIGSKDLSKINAVIQLLHNYHSELNELQWKEVIKIISQNYNSLDPSKVNEIKKVLSNINSMRSKDDMFEKTHH